MSEGINLINSAQVQGAYRSSKGLSDNADLLVQGADKTTSFADLVQGATSNAVAALREADSVAQAGMVGAAGTQEVVEATIALESTVKIAVSMRDKLVSAYQEILRMPI